MCLPASACQSPENPCTPAFQDVTFARAFFCLFLYLLPTRPGTEGLFCPSCSRTLVTASENRKPDRRVTESGGPAACCSKASLERHAGWKGKLTLFPRPANREEGRLMFKGRHPPASQCAGAFKGGVSGNMGGGATCRNRAGSSKARLQTGHGWSDQHPLG